MEAPELHEVKMNRPRDIRQSPFWGAYLEKFGWRSIRTSSDIGMSVRPTFIGSLIKIQRPHILTVEDLQEIDELAKKQKALMVKIEPEIGQNESLLTNAGYQYSRFPQCPPSSMFIDLTLSEEELWSKVSRSGKYSINRSRREGDTFEIYRNPSREILDSFYAVAKETAHLKRFYLMPIDDYLARIEVFCDKSFVALTRNKNGAVSGAKFYLEDAGLVLYVSGGTVGDARKHKSGYLLMWESILAFRNFGFKALDLEGVDDPRFPFYTKDWGGFSHFKEKFGGEVVRFPVPYIKYFSPILRKLSKFAPFSL